MPSARPRVSPSASAAAATSVRYSHRSNRGLLLRQWANSTPSRNDPSCAQRSRMPAGSEMPTRIRRDDARPVDRLAKANPRRSRHISRSVLGVLAAFGATVVLAPATAAAAVLRTPVAISVPPASSTVIAVASVSTPTVTVPSLAAPSVITGPISTPQVTTPTITTPPVTTPSVGIPAVQVPTVGAPPAQRAHPRHRAPSPPRRPPHRVTTGRRLRLHRQPADRDPPCRAPHPRAGAPSPRLRILGALPRAIGRGALTIRGSPPRSDRHRGPSVGPRRTSTRTAPRQRDPQHPSELSIPWSRGFPRRCCSRCSRSR
jgi:hypothetical protein